MNRFQNLLSKSTCAATPRVRGEAPQDRAADHEKQGKAVQVDPIKLTLKAPGTNLSKLEFDKLLSKFCFRIQLAPLQQGRGAHLAG
jgi:hypothetical protein